MAAFVLSWRSMKLVLLVISLAWAAAAGAERRVDPTFLKRSLPALAERSGDYGGPGVHYRPAFGAGDADAHAAKGLARYGELRLDPGASTAMISLAAEEQAVVVLEGRGSILYSDGEHGIRANDFFYLPAAVRYRISAASGEPCRMIVMGFRIRGDAGAPPPKFLIANLEGVKKQVVGNHPPTTLYQLMIGDRKSTRDAIAAGRTLTSLYVMEFAPGGTNFPHHHETEEEAYLLLDGEGSMVAGPGMDGVEGKFAAKAGDAYLFRLNCTVGFYNGNRGKSHILAARWLFPFPKRAE
jgi:mannose-6-phosphate isomerase-like protein (cupin superfamily)